MASVTLKAIWLNVADNPSDHVALRYVTGFSRSNDRPGEVRRGAGGRTRAFFRAGREVKWQVGFKVLTPAQKRWLEDHAGQLLCIRDDRGHKIFGTFMSVPITERTYSHEGDTSLDIVELSHSEAV